ncbi:MAG: chorismate synthase [Clostridia bacterium]
MSSVWGEKLKISLFGESHGTYIGAVLDGFPCGFSIDYDTICAFMNRRKPSQLGTKRHENDQIQIISGLYNNKTDGSPITFLIKNTDAWKNENEYLIARPSHIDFVSYSKFNGYNDVRGAGHLSGRLTAAVTAIGALCYQYLLSKNIVVGAHIKSIYNIIDDNFDNVNVNSDILNNLKLQQLPLLNHTIYSTIIDIVNQNMLDKDNIGGVIECAAINLPLGLGEPFFYGLDSIIASLLFSIPAVKSVEFGSEDIDKQKASEVNDQFIQFDNNIKTSTNNSGGLNGGISNGMPLIVRVGFKPAPTISRIQTGLNLKTMQTEEIIANTRNDTCIALRASPIVESAVSIALVEAILLNKNIQ